MLKKNTETYLNAANFYQTSKLNKVCINFKEMVSGSKITIFDQFNLNFDDKKSKSKALKQVDIKVLQTLLDKYSIEYTNTETVHALMRKFINFVNNYVPETWDAGFAPKIYNPTTCAESSCGKDIPSNPKENARTFTTVKGKHHEIAFCDFNCFENFDPGDKPGEKRVERKGSRDRIA